MVRWIFKDLLVITDALQVVTNGRYPALIQGPTPIIYHRHQLPTWVIISNLQLIQLVLT